MFWCCKMESAIIEENGDTLENIEGNRDKIANIEGDRDKI